MTTLTRLEIEIDGPQGITATVTTPSPKTAHAYLGALVDEHTRITDRAAGRISYPVWAGLDLARSRARAFASAGCRPSAPTEKTSDTPPINDSKPKDVSSAPVEPASKTEVLTIEDPDGNPMTHDQVVAAITKPKPRAELVKAPSAPPATKPPAPRKGVIQDPKNLLKDCKFTEITARHSKPFDLVTANAHGVNFETAGIQSMGRVGIKLLNILRATAETHDGRAICPLDIRTMKRATDLTKDQIEKTLDRLCRLGLIEDGPHGLEIYTR